MTLIDIENMTFADLKAQRDDAVRAAAEANKADIAARYVQARIDAKLRDETLAEQGKTITALQAGIDALQQKALGLEVELKATHEAHAATIAKCNDNACKLADEEKAREQDRKAAADQLAATIHKADAAMASVISERTAVITALTAERDLAIALAKQRRMALAEVMTVISPVLASEQ